MRNNPFSRLYACVGKSSSSQRRVDSRPDTFLTSPFRRTGTIEAVSAAGAGATVGAGIAGTVIDRAVGRIAHESGIADALSPMGVLDADAVGRTSRVLAQTTQFTMAAREARRTFAVVGTNVVDTLTVVVARPG